MIWQKEGGQGCSKEKSFKKKKTHKGSKRQTEIKKRKTKRNNKRKEEITQHISSEKSYQVPLLAC